VNGVPLSRTRWSDWDGLAAAERASLIGIYEDSFPAAERNPVSRFGRVPLRFWLALDDRQDVLGFCAVGHLSECAYLQYIAVAAPWRNRGIGAGLLNVLAADLATAGYRGIVLEIDDPAHAEDREIAERRRAFYARWGAQPVPDLTGYVIPDRVDPDTDVPMLLLWRHVRRTGTADADPPTGDRLRSLIEQLYTFEYAEFAPRDYLSRVLAGVSPPDRATVRDARR
jgi:GNAT superfamily N-acetyltransferase